MSIGILLINLGTPESPSVKDVRKYLREFLNDPRVIDIPFFLRLLLVNLFIIPFRAPKSAKLYQKIWTKNGSPLLYNSIILKEKLQEKLGNTYVVELAMRYQQPSIKNALKKLKSKSPKKIIALPLYPQYASSSTGSSVQKVLEEINTWQVIPSIETINEFYSNPLFIDCWIEIAKKYNLNEYDHILFSYHGLPERQIKKASAAYGNNYCQLDKCCNKITSCNTYCYRANCFETSRLIAQKLNITVNQYTISFQSRLGKSPWIKPYSDEIIIRKAKEGIKKMLVFSPAFTADCLETIHEIGEEYNELFKEHGGEKIQLVESLNYHPKWVETLEHIIKAKAN